MASGYYELKKGKAFSFNLKAANHQVILTSQTYESKAAAENGIASVRTNGTDDSKFERKISTGGKPFFSLKAANGQIIGTSERYNSDAAMENGVESVKVNCVSTEVKDLTAL